MRKPVDPSTATARAGLGVGDTGDGVDLVAPLSLASVRAYADLPSVDEAMDPIEADEERNAAMESEWMKGSKR